MIGSNFGITKCQPQLCEPDNLVYSDVIEKVRIHYDLIVFEQGPEIIMQSKKYKCELPKFLIKINQTGTHHTGIYTM